VGRTRRLREATVINLEFGGPADVTGADHLDAAGLLRKDWQGRTTEYDDYDEENEEEYQDDDFARSIAQATREGRGPGLGV
jgi:hypothetical protein